MEALNSMMWQNENRVPFSCKPGVPKRLFLKVDVLRGFLKARLHMRFLSRTLGFAFFIPQKSSYQNLSPQKVTTKFQTPKKSSDRKFQTQKRASHIPVTYIPEYPPWACVTDRKTSQSFNFPHVPMWYGN